MNLHQFRFVQAAVKNNLNLTETAQALHTSQPGISKAIIELEQELGIQIFARHGKRLKRVTEPGTHVLQSINTILGEVANLKRIGEEYSAQDSGTLSIATTHTQARYVLPTAIGQMRAQYPKVRISLHQGTPREVRNMLLDETATVAIATEAITHDKSLVSLPCYEWQHILIMPRDHPLEKKQNLSLQDLANEALVTYHPSFTGRTRIDQAFEKQELQPNIVLEAIDSDVLKTYVRLGLGIGIVAETAWTPEDARDLCTRKLAHLFGYNTTRMAFRRNAYLRTFVLDFAQMISANLSHDLILQAMQGKGSHDEL